MLPQPKVVEYQDQEMYLNTYEHSRGREVGNGFPMRILILIFGSERIDNRQQKMLSKKKLQLQLQSTAKEKLHEPRSAYPAQPAWPRTATQPTMYTTGWVNFNLEIPLTGSSVKVEQGYRDLGFAS
jgi:hypothetical protein